MTEYVASLSEAMKSIFNDKASSDFTITCKGQNLYVHTLVLNTRSTYFRGLTDGHFKVNENSLIRERARS